MRFKAIKRVVKVIQDNLSDELDLLSGNLFSCSFSAFSCDRLARDHDLVRSSLFESILCYLEQVVTDC